MMLFQRSLGRDSMPADAEITETGEQELERKKKEKRDARAGKLAGTGNVTSATGIVNTPVATVANMVGLAEETRED